MRDNDAGLPQANLRLWLVTWSLSVVGVLLLFLVVAPSIGFPLTAEQATRVGQILLPTFLGYLGMATTFIFKAPSQEAPMAREIALVKLLVKGPPIIFSVVVTVALFIFWHSNVVAPPGSGMNIDTLASYITASVGLLAASTGVAMTNLFSVEGSS